ncbi:MAG: (d)CMP kinase [Anaerolineaceae bacterium]|jgi:cytidylate kinase
MSEKTFNDLPKIIAIDGPAASGKSTIGTLIANQLGYICLDTGIMYRAVAFQALKEGINVFDELAVSELSERIKIDILPSQDEDNRQFTVLIEGEDHTWDIRTPDVNRVVSEVSVYPRVRTAMTDLQRKIGEKGNIVMIGRDIGTVVLPNADLKIYLDASVEVRAQRRYIEDLSRGKKASFDEVLDSLRHRDQIDSGRAVAPLKPADDAIIVDSDKMTVYEVVEHVLGLIQKK